MQIYNILKDFIYLFLQGLKEGEQEGEKHQCVVAFCAPPTGDLAQLKHVPWLGIESVAL